jgi:hypothetical protein
MQAEPLGRLNHQSLVRHSQAVAQGAMAKLTVRVRRCGAALVLRLSVCSSVAHFYFCLHNTLTGKLAPPISCGGTIHGILYILRIPGCFLPRCLEWLYCHCDCPNFVVVGGDMAQLHRVLHMCVFSRLFWPP